MELVIQRTPHDCAICCLAMVTGRSYEDVLETVGDTFDPAKGMRQESVALQRLGYSYTFENGESVGDILCQHSDWALSPALYRRMVWGRRSLLSLPSLNNPGGWHMVYWDGERVWDPSPNKTYATLVGVAIQELVLFRENRA